MQSFTLSIPDADIADLRERLGRTRFPDQAPGEPWAFGSNVEYMRGLVDYWRTSGNWSQFCRPLGADDFECQ